MYTLWLMPDKATYLKLSKLIAELSTTHDAPSFEPHVTLLSGIVDDLGTAVNKTKQFAESLTSITARLTRIEFLEYYYRCLFFRTDESPALMKAREEAENFFEHTHIHPFIPHVSFLYGSLPVFQKEAIVSDLGAAFLVDFRLTKLRLVKTQRTPEHWELIKEYTL